MVSNITSLSGVGLRDWLIQRVSAVVIAAYVLMILGFMMIHAPMDYATWTHLFKCSVVRVSSVLFLLSLILHAWVGVWTITTDYLNCVCLRLFVQISFACMLISAFFWGIYIFWGI